eukprot:jgi/Hompol1/2687/HPOL_006123-RA
MLAAIAVLAAAAGALAAPGYPPNRCVAGRKAIVTLTPDPTVPAGAKVAGTITFAQSSADQLIQFTADLSGLPVGTHGWHVHAGKTILPNCTAAGGHFNPYNTTHGAPTDAVRHVGDFGNIVVGSDGTFQTTVTDRLASLFDNASNIIGHAFVIHGGVDDLGLGNSTNSKINGNAGPRLACGIITAA